MIIDDVAKIQKNHDTTKGFRLFLRNFPEKNQSPFFIQPEGLPRKLNGLPQKLNGL